MSALLRGFTANDAHNAILGKGGGHVEGGHGLTQGLGFDGAHHTILGKGGGHVKGGHGQALAQLRGMLRARAAAVAGEAPRR